MNEARLTVRSCGPLVSYQDRGRFGMMRFGVPASGPMDRLAHAAALIALSRPEGSTAIEISMGGLELICETGEVTCCVAGGQFQVTHGGSVTASWCVQTIRAGEALSVRPGPWGSWAYLAFSGELICNHWAGSSSTHASSGLGGGNLTSGAAIVVRNPEVFEEREGELVVSTLARPRGVARVVLGPQTEQFEPNSLAVLVRDDFAVTSAYDRMGMRLAGPKLALRDGLSIPSEPIVRGSIQVSGDGVASILLADHQTTGGYPKVATILSSDTDAVSQLRPRDRLSFQAVGADEAIQLVRSHALAVQQFFKEVAAPRSTLTDRLMRENLISGVTGG
jgi:biotin-dependent carboxylase-like uncharacterized protein